ncbi:CHASE domain-containing protein [Azohydromonas australica]|uniref:CHASE domain-containing protein n=1 Tax=Azohydromonas australica TaxID=364039 RepID=UPI000414DEF7|nr:CHASE domain-containing protein [Azohydromonas australica]
MNDEAQGASVTDKPPAGKGQRQGVRSTWLLPMCVLAASLTLTGAGVVLLERSIAAATEARFKRLVERVERDIQLRFQQPLYAVDGLRSVSVAMPDIDRQTFRSYVQARDLPRNFPSVRGLGYVQRVPREQLGQFITSAQAEADAEFEVYTDNPAGDLFVLRYIEPMEINRHALGFDLGSETVRREAIERAARTGLPALTSRITLRQDEQRRASFMFMAPIYRPGAPLNTAEERMAALSGLAVAPVVVQQLMAGLDELTERQMDIEMFDGATTQTAQRVFAFAASEAPRMLASQRGLLATRELEIGGHTLTLQIHGTQAFDAGINPRLPAALGLGGTAMSLLLALSVWLLAMGRARAERRAREMTADLDRLAKVVQHTSNAVVIIDGQRRVDWVNEGFQRIFGYRREAVLGMAPDEMLRLAGVEPAQLERMREALWQGTPWRGELCLRNRQDENCWADVEIQPLMEQGGPVKGLMAIASDITASKLAQQRLHETIRELERTQVALREAHERAEGANVAKSQFLANMSHEIRTPMNAIIGMANLVMESDLDDDQRELLSVVNDSAQSLLSLINDILDFSKIEAGHLDFEHVGFDLHEQVIGTVRTLAERAREKSLTLEWVIARDVPRRVMGDPHRLRQVLLNLLSNAVKFTLHGGVTLIVSRRPEANSGDGCQLHFRVRDTGVGIPPDKLEAVFEPFTQADASTTRRFGGTGLGLAICRRLVGLMGGELWAESEPDKGSTFHFTARLGLQSSAEDELLQADGTQPMPRVLVLDAGAVQDSGLEATLAQWQLKPVFVAELPEAVRLLESPARHHRAIQSVLVRASTLPRQPAEHLARLLPRLCDTAVHERPVILLEDEPLPQAQRRLFETAVAWPGVPSVLFDAMTAVEGFAHSALHPPDAAAAGSVGGAEGHFSVLLAEDNVINQKLAVRLLEGMGHQVQVVANGQDAVRLAQAEDFDLVLMDVQMPLMGGFEATSAIRAHEQPLGRHTPIVAMTAHAMVGDRERCLAAGMDGYLSKPISKLELYRAVQEHARRRDEGVAAPGALSGDADADATPAQGKSAYLSLYDRARAVELLGGDDELFDEVALMFADHAGSERQALHNALSASDLGQLGRVAHGLKGSSATVGAAAVSELAAELEQACMAQTQERVGPLVDRLCQGLEALEARLRQDLGED